MFYIFHSVFVGFFSHKKTICSCNGETCLTKFIKKSIKDLFKTSCNKHFACTPSSPSCVPKEMFQQLEKAFKFSLNSLRFWTKLMRKIYQKHKLFKVFFCIGKYLRHFQGSDMILTSNLSPWRKTLLIIFSSFDGVAKKWFLVFKFYKRNPNKLVIPSIIILYQYLAFLNILRLYYF